MKTPFDYLCGASFLRKKAIPMQVGEPTRAILVVDDNASIRRLVKAFLEAAGYTVIIAVDGEAALDFFMRNRPAIALLLTDVEMPRMNGLDLADRVLELEGNLPVLFMSGTTGRADRGYGCVAKPFRGAELVARVEVVLQQQAA
jgi:DNA-binding response OmpR family regulator